MRRDISRFANDTYDLLVIGGGIYGACTAWDAAVRGLKVVLVEKDDFGHATSANSLKVIHGGLRYLSRGQVATARLFASEQARFSQLAPHLVRPIPFVLPLQGRGLKGRTAADLGLLLSNQIRFGLAPGKDSSKRLPNGMVVSSQEFLAMFPEISVRNLTGAALWYDCQIHNSERLTLAFVMSAERSGAEIANYTKVLQIERSNGHVTGASISDEISGDRFEIKAKVVVNASGPWLLRASAEGASRRQTNLVKAINLVVDQVFSERALALPSAPEATAANLGHLFIVPWRNKSIVGTAYFPSEAIGDDLAANEAEIETFLELLGRTFPAANIARDKISFIHSGLVPVMNSTRGRNGVSRQTRPIVLDHGSDGYQGLFSLLGTKYTLARFGAEKVVDQAFRALGFRPKRIDLDGHQLVGGNIDHFETFMKDQRFRLRKRLSEKDQQTLLLNYGSEYRKVLPEAEGPINGNGVATLEMLRNQVLYAVHSEMAQKLGDVVFRRTDVGSAGNPGSELINYCAEVMGAELHWSPTQVRNEIDQVGQQFQRHKANANLAHAQ